MLIAICPPAERGRALKFNDSTPNIEDRLVPIGGIKRCPRLVEFVQGISPISADDCSDLVHD